MATTPQVTRNPRRPTREAASRQAIPVTWVRSGGLEHAAVRAADGLRVRDLLLVADRAVGHHELPEDEPHRRRTWVGLDNFTAVLRDPLLPTAVLNTAYFAVLALIFGFPMPLIMAVLMSEVRRGKGLYSALAYLPVVIPPVVAVLLWKFFYDASPEGVFNTMLGWVGHPAAAVAPEPTRAMPVARARGDLGRGRRLDHHLPRRAAQRARRSSTTRPRSTAPASGARSGTSRCRSCAASCSSC